VSLINYEERIFANYLGTERVIMHKGLSHWSPSYIDEKWEEVQIEAFGPDVYVKMKAEKLSKEQQEMTRAKELRQLVNKKRVEFQENKKKVELKKEEKEWIKAEDEKRLNEQLNRWRTP
jgi:predicted flavoprotein YhiN